MRAALFFLLLGAPPATPTPTVADARAFAAAQPRYLQPVPHSGAPAGLPNLRAETCGACHAEIYAEWRISTHARAWADDAQFQEELKKSRANGIDVGWTCLNCHTPLESQQARLVAGLAAPGRIEQPIYVANPNFDPALQADAITCATCHVRDGVVLGPYGDTAAPHPVRKDPSLLAVDVCTQCHQAKALFQHIPLACVFDTGAEFAAGPYPAEGATCQTCHMPAVERPLMAGYPARPTRRHWFGGSLIPKAPRFAAELEPLQAVYPDGLTARLEAPATARAGQAVEVALVAENANAGHMLPTGDPERFIDLRAEAVGPDGAILARAEARFGAVYQWSPTVAKLADTRLAPREARRYPLRFVAPARGPVTLRVVAEKWRISQENFDYHALAGRAVRGRTFIDRATTLPVEAKE